MILSHIVMVWLEDIACISKYFWVKRFLLYLVRKKTLGKSVNSHYDVIKWKHFPRYWPFVWGIQGSPVDFPHKGQWRGAFMFSLICAWTNGLLSGVPDFFDRNKILSGGDLSHYQVPHCIRVFFYFVWFVFIHHNFQFYFELCTYCNILDIYLS